MDTGPSRRAAQQRDEQQQEEEEEEGEAGEQCVAAWLALATVSERYPGDESTAVSAAACGRSVGAEVWVAAAVGRDTT